MRTALKSLVLLAAFLCACEGPISEDESVSDSKVVGDDALDSRDDGPQTDSLNRPDRLAMSGCPAGTAWSAAKDRCAGSLDSVLCDPGEVLSAGECVPLADTQCGSGTTFDPVLSECPPGPGCGEGSWPVDGECVPLYPDWPDERDRPVETSGQFVFAGALAPDETDRLEFTADAFGAIRISLHTRSGPELNLRVSSETIDHFERFLPETGPATRDFVFPARGTYFVDVSSEADIPSSYVILFEPIPGPRPRTAGPGATTVQFDDIDSRLLEWTPSGAGSQQIRVADASDTLIPGMSGLISRGHLQSGWSIDGWPDSRFFLEVAAGERLFIFVDPVRPESSQEQYQVVLGEPSPILDRFALELTEQSRVLDTNEAVVATVPGDSVMYLRGYRLRVSSTDGVPAPMVAADAYTAVQGDLGWRPRVYSENAKDWLIVETEAGAPSFAGVYRPVQHATVQSGGISIIGAEEVHWGVEDSLPSYYWDDGWPDVALKVELPPGYSRWTIPAISGKPALGYSQVFWNLDEGALDPALTPHPGVPHFALVRSQSSHLFADLSFVSPESLIEVESISSSPVNVVSSSYATSPVTRTAAQLLQFPNEFPVDLEVVAATDGLARFISTDTKQTDGAWEVHYLYWPSPEDFATAPEPTRFVVELSSSQSVTVPVHPFGNWPGSDGILYMRMLPQRPSHALNPETVTRIALSGMRDVTVTSPLGPDEELWLTSPAGLLIDGPPGAVAEGPHYGMTLDSAGTWTIENALPLVVYRGVPVEEPPGPTTWNSPAHLGTLSNMPIAVSGTATGGYPDEDCFSVDVPALGHGETAEALVFYNDTVDYFEDNNWLPHFFWRQGPAPASRERVCAGTSGPPADYLLLIELNPTWIPE